MNEKMTLKEALSHMEYIKEIIQAEIPWTKSDEALEVAEEALKQAINAETSNKSSVETEFVDGWGHCPVCGNGLTEHDHYCSNCGVSITSQKKKPTSGDVIREILGSESRYWSNICQIAEEQRKKGMGKYGFGLEKNPADIKTRLRYLEEELIDGLMYCEWILEALEKEKLK